jgi:hypothetical protein
MKLRLLSAFVLIASMALASVSVSAHHEGTDDYYPIATDEFWEAWERTDLPVHELVVARTWIWSPAAHTPLLTEDYVEGEDGERKVQYFDKSRMEMPTLGVADPDDEESPWFITQGLLATELMTGQLQLGDDTFEQYNPSNRSAAGDPGDATAPTYAAMGTLIERDARVGGEVIVEYANREGAVVEDAARFASYGVTDVEGDWQDVEGIDKNIASVFWDFMTSTGIVYEDGEYVDDQPIFLNAFYAVGYPLTDAFWADVMVKGVVQDVLIQCFERRCLTYTPGNPEGWEVESGNIGQHYYHWRYTEIPAQERVVEIDLQPELAFNPYHYNREEDIPIIAQALYDAALSDEAPEGRFGTVEEIEAHLEQFVEHEQLDLAQAISAWIEAGVVPPDPDDVRLEAEVESWWDGGPFVGQVLAHLGIELDDDFVGGFIERGQVDLVVVLEAALDQGLITEDQYAEALEFAATGGGFHEVTAEVTVNGELATEGAVSFLVTDEHTGEVLVDWALEGIEIENGVATFSYWPPVGGVHTITASVVGTDVEATANKVWTGVVLSVQPAEEPGS